jgi:predicted Zn-dependent protease
MPKLIRIPCLLLLAAIPVWTGCATFGATESKPTLSKRKGRTPAGSELERMTKRLTQGPLQPDEVETYFLVAEQLYIGRNIQLAERFFEAVFEASATLVTGLRLNEIYLLSGQFDDAEALVQKLRVLYPDDVEPPIALARILFAQGKKAEALKAIKDAYEHGPENDAIGITYIDLLLKSEKTAEARRLLEKMVAQPSPNPFFLQKLAEIELKEKKIARARALLERLLRVAPENIEGWTLAGFAAMEENNTADAERYFREAYIKQPENDALARYYVLQLLRQEKYQEARRLLLKLEAAADADHPLDAELTFHLGYVFFELEDYSEAKTRFLALAAVGENSDRGNYFAAQCEEAQKKYAAAEKLYRSLPPDSEYAKQALQRIVQMNLDQGRNDEAAKTLSALKIDDKSEEFEFRFMASAYARLKQYDKAIATAKEGLKRFSKSAELEFLAATWLEHTASVPAALAAVEETLRKHPNHAQSKNYVAYTLAERTEHPERPEGKARLEQALTLAQKAVAQEPKNGFFLDTLGWILFKLGSLDQAENTLNRALALEQEEPIIYEHLGEVMLARKNPAAALKQFEAAQKCFSAQPDWKVQADREWRESQIRVRKRIDEIRKSALTP